MGIELFDSTELSETAKIAKVAAHFYWQVDYLQSMVSLDGPLTIGRYAGYAVNQDGDYKHFMDHTQMTLDIMENYTDTISEDDIIRLVTVLQNIFEHDYSKLNEMLVKRLNIMLVETSKVILSRYVGLKSNLPNIS